MTAPRPGQTWLANHKVGQVPVEVELCWVSAGAEVVEGYLLKRKAGGVTRGDRIPLAACRLISLQASTTDSPGG